MDPVRDQARKFAGIVILVALAILCLFEAIAHHGEGPDAPGASQPSASVSAPVINAPGQP